MVEELEVLVAAFPGEANRTRCFAHIINLVAKSVLQQYEIPKAKSGKSMDKSTRGLPALAGDLEFEEELCQDENEEGEEDDNIEGLKDECEVLSQTERQALDEEVQPVRQVLMKVSMDQRTRDPDSPASPEICHSSARQPTQSRTHRPSSYQSGMPPSMNSG
jgi:hypothetical protein